LKVFSLVSEKSPRALLAVAVAVATCSLVPVAAYSQDESRVVEEIVVTARMREETLLEIPVAVSVLNQDQIIERGIFDTAQLSDFTPGLTLQNFGQGGTSGRNNPNIRFRGLGVQASSPAARAGAIFWDGAYISDGVGVLPLIDLERVEVIKGPQTAFFGRNTFAGAVNYLPARPTDEVEGRIIAAYAPDSKGDSYELSGAVGGPITDTLGYRVSGITKRNGADYEFGDGSPLGEEDTLSVWGTLEWDVNESLSLRFSTFIVDASDTRSTVTQPSTVASGDCNQTFSGNYREIGGGLIPGGAFTTDLSQKSQNIFCGSMPDWDKGEFRAPAFGDDRLTDKAARAYPNASENVRTLPVEFGNEDMPSAPGGFGNEYEVSRFHLAGDYALDNGSVISAFVSHGESGFWSIGDADNGFNEATRPSGFARKITDTSYELRIASSADQRLRWGLGINYYEQDQIAGNFEASCRAGLDPCQGADMDLQNGDNLGIFGSLDYDITDALTVSFEGRWAEDTQTIEYQGLTGGEIGATTDEDTSYSEFMPRVILSWQPTDTINIYGSYSKSYLQGQATNVVTYADAVIRNPNDGTTDYLDQRADLVDAVGLFTGLQELDAFELGVKQQLGFMNYSVALYYMDWLNQNFFDLSLPAFAAVNLPGDAEYTGIELEWNAALTDWATFSGGFNYVKAEFKDFGGAGSVANEVLAPGQNSLFNPAITPGQQIDATGNSPRYIPATTGNLSLDVRFPIGEMGFYARADAIWNGDTYIDNFEYNKIDGFWKLNLRAGLDVNDSTRVELYGLNVTDDRSWLSAGGTTGVSFFSVADRRGFGVLPQAREVGLRVVANF
jgi:iron complex outermembrane receptor protein